MMSPFQAEILKENINSWVGMVFIASCALGAGLLIWHTTYGENPLANALAVPLEQQFSTP